MAPNTNLNVFHFRYITQKPCLFALVLIFLQLKCTSCATRVVPAGNSRGISIKPGNNYKVENNSSEPLLSTFCWTGDPKSVFALWKTATVFLNIEDEDFSFYRGDNATHVAHLHQILSQSWFSYLPWKEKSMSISPFNSTCTGVYTKSSYSLRLDLRQINFNRLLVFAIGFVLFMIAPSVCEKVIFHYTTGTLIGVLGSVLIIVYLTSRLIPKKSGAYAVLIGGSSIVFYLLRNLWDNLYSVLQEYHYYVLAYLITSAVISFAFCYRFGPVTNPKTIHLLQWTLQFVGLCLIFASSEHKEAAMSIILVTLVVHNFPHSWWSQFQTLWFKRFPPKVNLLNEEEYIDQGRIETEKALSALRDFSRSPNCNAWKTMSRLKDPIRKRSRCVEFVTPPNNKSRRFAEFVEGKSHLADREVLDYETTTLIPQDSESWTDDESD